MPPSSDSPKHKAEATKTRAALQAEAKAKRRDDVERNWGKEPGALGANLAMRPDPDEIVDHEPTSCGSCGNDLSDTPIEGIERRQVFDTPAPVVSCTEHRAVTRRCTCGAIIELAAPGRTATDRSLTSWQPPLTWQGKTHRSSRERPGQTVTWLFAD